MIHYKKIICSGIFGLILLFAFPPLAAQTTSEAEKFKIDSTLHAYYARCRECIKTPIVLAMSDTLFRMSKAKGDQRMQAVALSTKLEFYYFKGMADSIQAHVNLIKAFAKATNQPKYYYFAWGKRLIMSYIKRGMLTTALYEADKMLKEAQQSNEKSGLATCYNCLGNIYELKKMRNQSLECRLKEVELIETYKLDDYNLSLIYTAISSHYIENNELKSALLFIKKAEDRALTPAHKASCMSQYISYYLAAKQPEMAWEYLQNMQLLYNSNKQLATYAKRFYEAEIKYYMSTGQHKKTLEAIDENYKAQKEQGEEGINIELIRQRGMTYWHAGDSKRAAQYLMEYVQVQDSINSINELNSASEFATLLGVEKLNADNKGLQVKVQEEQLQYARNITFLLGAGLLIGIIFLLRERRLNKRLKNSENSLIVQNNRLIESEEMLRLAKERAERSSQMKTAFIQNMTHEIRTPLNSIVGFSHVISDLYQENGETREFANIIEENSSKLLRLIDDVLNISDLESNETLQVSTININDYCLLSIERAKPYVEPGVSLLFHPVCDEMIVTSNGERLSQILFNLLHNAAKFTSKGSIELSYHLSEDRSRLLLAVTDTGIGVPENQQNKVFERFFKINDFEQGSGLGLSIGRLLAQKLGGSLDIDKEYKEGCRFILSIPYLCPVFN